MISGQTLYSNTAEESFIPIQNETNLIEIAAETVEAAEDSTPVENTLPKLDLKSNFARLKKAMRRRSVSIF